MQGAGRSRDCAFKKIGGKKKKKKNVYNRGLYHVRVCFRDQTGIVTRAMSGDPGYVLRTPQGHPGLALWGVYRDISWQTFSDVTCEW